MFSKKNTIFFIAFVALAVRLLLIFSEYQNAGYSSAQLLNNSRVDGYYEIAENLAKYKVFGQMENGVVTQNSVRTPGAPLLFYIFSFGTKYFVVALFFQALVGAAIVLLSYYLCKSLLFPANVSLVAAFFLALDPNATYLTTKFFTEQWFTFFLLVSCLIGIKLYNRHIAQSSNSIWSFGLLGLSLGVATLIRPTLLYFVIIAGVFLLGFSLLKKSRVLITRSVFAILFFAILITPWCIRNARLFQTLTFSTISSQVIVHYLAPSVISESKHMPFALAKMSFFNAIGFNGGEINADQAPGLTKHALRIVVAEPRATAVVAAKSLVTFFTHDGALDYFTALGVGTKGKISPIVPILQITIRVFWLLCLALSVTRVYTLYNTKRLTLPHVLAVLLVLYFAITTIANGYAVNARFRFPVEVFLLAFGLDGARYLWYRFNVNKAHLPTN